MRFQAQAILTCLCFEFSHDLQLRVTFPLKESFSSLLSVYVSCLLIHIDAHIIFNSPYEHISYFTNLTIF